MRTYAEQQPPKMFQTREAPAADAVTLAPGVVLARGRAHEVAGASRIALALITATRLDGPVVWIEPARGGDRLAGDGLRALVDPCRLLIGRGRAVPEQFWAAEEALRSGVVPLVVLDLPVVPAMTPVRRLHLAAESGAAAGRAPLALLLTPGAGGASGVETRWRFDPVPGWARDGNARWRLTRLRARLAPEATWEAGLVRGGLRLGPAGPPGEPPR